MLRNLFGTAPLPPSVSGFVHSCAHRPICCIFSNLCLVFSLSQGVDLIQRSQHCPPKEIKLLTIHHCGTLHIQMKFEDELETSDLKVLCDSEREKLAVQDSRLLSSWQAERLEAEAKKHWDLFYKRNENRFFKDRHWTMREFKELLQIEEGSRKRLFEVGCGTGNLIYPLLEEHLSLEFWVCDISPRALDIVKQHPLYNDEIVHTVLADITELGSLSSVVEMDLVTLVFVLSTLHPDKMKAAVENVCATLKVGGTLLFRDYARWDMTQLRFGPGRKISDNFYARQDGTRSYFFTIEEVDELFSSAGLNRISNVYIKRRTVNKKESIDVPRYFVQAKYIKPQV